ncbi:MAG: PAS domain-containing sensor histidine kinase [Bacteroidales bacterium]|nr:PAS domain-containing sensor histidine kinase [Bacteroidales bacterium]
MNTHFASYHRASTEEVMRDFHTLKSIDYINELIAALPYVVTILNKDRQIVYSNDALLKKIGVTNMQEVLGNRPGEALNCIHKDSMEAGCGTSKNCDVCGAVNTILKCQETGLTATDECRIRTRDGEGTEDCLDLEVTATPFHWDDRQYIIFIARDISGEKRKEALERIFFHDVINTAGTLQGVVDLLKQQDDPKKIKQFIDLLAMVSQDLTQEILNQKSLLAAENGDLAVTKHEFYLKETLGHIIREYRRHDLALNKEIHFLEDSCEVIINTDPVLLRRIISNMIKNSLEAISVEERISIDCVINPDTVTIRVHNPGSMPESVRKQIFQRSYSTKGKGRGLGTYSMKLLGEKYLDGKISFSTDKKEGTLFRIELPVTKKKSIP